MRARSLALTVLLVAAAAFTAAVEPPRGADAVVPATLDGSSARRWVVDLSTPIPVNRFHVVAYGPTCGPSRLSAHVADGASFSHRVEIDHGGMLAVALDGPVGADLQLRLLGPSGRLVAVSPKNGPDHTLVVRLPVDGSWRVEVLGVAVPAGWAEFDLTVDAVQGGGIDVVGAPDGPIAAGEPIPVAVRASGSPAECAAPRVLLVYGPPGGETQELTLTLPATASRGPAHRVAGVLASR